MRLTANALSSTRAQHQSDTPRNTFFSSRPTVHRMAYGAHKWATSPHHQHTMSDPTRARHSLPATTLAAPLPVDLISPSAFVACAQRQPHDRPADGLTAELRDRREQHSRDRARPGRVEPGVIPHAPLSPRPCSRACHTPTTHRRPGRRRVELGRCCALRGTMPIARASSHASRACMHASARQIVRRANDSVGRAVSGLLAALDRAVRLDSYS